MNVTWIKKFCNNSYKGQNILGNLDCSRRVGWKYCRKIFSLCLNLYGEKHKIRELVFKLFQIQPK